MRILAPADHLCPVTMTGNGEWPDSETCRMQLPSPDADGLLLLANT